MRARVVYSIPINLKYEEEVDEFGAHGLSFEDWVKEVCSSDNLLQAADAAYHQFKDDFSTLIAEKISVEYVVEE